MCAWSSSASRTRSPTTSTRVRSTCSSAASCTTPTSPSPASRRTCTSAWRPRACSRCACRSTARRRTARRRGRATTRSSRRTTSIAASRRCPSRGNRATCSTGRRSTSRGSSAATRSTRCPTSARSTSTSATCRVRTPARSWRRSARSPSSRSSRSSRACRRSSRGATRTCSRCARRSESRSRARRCRSAATVPPTRSRSSRRGSPRSSSGRSARAITGPRNGSRWRHSRATGGRWATSSGHCRARCGPTARSRRCGHYPRPLVAVYEERPPRPAFGVYKRAALGAVSILLLTAAAVATTVLLQVKTSVDIFNSVTHRIPHIKGALDGVSARGPQTILVLGGDRRVADIKAKNPVRSDTIMLLRLDPSKGATAVVSIPRDLKVDIPGHGTAKINQAYSDGGPALTVRTVRQLLGIPINHVVNVNFGGFRGIVTRLKCVYVDIDRRYYHTNAGLGAGQQYAAINIPAGYQKLCGQKALDYVRYRHGDNDFIRSARQQDFLRQAKEQISLGTLFGDRNELIRIFGHYTDTDINSNTAILRLLKLAFESAKNPIQQIPFRAGEQNTENADYVVASPDQIRKTVDDFLNVKAVKKTSKTTASASDRQRAKRQRRRATSAYPGLFNASRAAEDQAVKLQLKGHLGFPVYYPKLARLGSSYVTDPATPRTYTIRDRSGRRYHAYRIVVQAPGFGQFYGVQGTNWMSPPIIDNPDEIVRLRHRDYQVFYDGRNIRLVAWRTPRAVYWVSNTLSESLSNKQMLGIARSLSRIGS